MTSLHITSLHVVMRPHKSRKLRSSSAFINELVRLQALNAATTQLTQRHRHADTHVCFVHHLRPRATAQRSRSVVILHTPTDYYKNPSSLVGYADSVSISPSTQEEWDTFAHYGLGQCG